MTRHKDLLAEFDRGRAHQESFKASTRVNAGTLDLNAAVLEEEARAGRTSPELCAQAVRLRERSAETEED
jgi:hypothetical protein